MINFALSFSLFLFKNESIPYLQFFFIIYYYSNMNYIKVPL